MHALLVLIVGGFLLQCSCSEVVVETDAILQHSASGMQAPQAAARSMQGYRRLLQDTR
jgi:hypothetical protein